MNIICRNILARCSSTILRDGRIQKTALNAVTDQLLKDEQVATGRRSMDNAALLKPFLFEPIPIDEIGPYESN